MQSNNFIYSEQIVPILAQIVNLLEQFTKQGNESTLDTLGKIQHKENAMKQESVALPNDKLERIKRNAIRHIEKAGDKGLTFRDMYRKIGAENLPKRDYLRKALDELVSEKIVESYNVSSSKKGGRPTERYRCLV